MEHLNLAANILDKVILKLFVNQYLNIDEIALQLNIPENEIINVLNKYTGQLQNYSFNDVIII